MNIILRDVYYLRIHYPMGHIYNPTLRYSIVGYINCLGKPLVL